MNQLQFMNELTPTEELVDTADYLSAEMYEECLTLIADLSKALTEARTKFYYRDHDVQLLENKCNNLQARLNGLEEQNGYMTAALSDIDNILSEVKTTH